jgi:hypothetical protein
MSEEFIVTERGSEEFKNKRDNYSELLIAHARILAGK